MSQMHLFRGCCVEICRRRDRGNYFFFLLPGSTSRVSEIKKNNIYNSFSLRINMLWFQSAFLPQTSQKHGRVSVTKHASKHVADPCCRLICSVLTFLTLRVHRTFCIIRWICADQVGVMCLEERKLLAWQPPRFHPDTSVNWRLKPQGLPRPGWRRTHTHTSVKPEHWPMLTWH